MAINIPQSVFDKYNEACDMFLTNDNFSRVCTLYYPPLKEECATCQANNTNVFAHGGTAPFSFNSCSYCGGNGYKETEVTDTVRLRIYFQKKDWIKVAQLAIPDAEAQIIGFMSDLPKVKNANKIKLVSEENALNLFFQLASEPLPHGFGKTRYFIAYVKHV